MYLWLPEKERKCSSLSRNSVRSMEFKVVVDQVKEMNLKKFNAAL